MKKLVSVCFALAALTTVARAANYAPLDCAEAASDAQKAVCANYKLGQGEARMATLFEWTTALVGMGQRGQIQDGQRAFIAAREACGAALRCLQELYAARVGELEKTMKDIAGRGPF